MKSFVVWHKDKRRDIAKHEILHFHVNFWSKVPKLDDNEFYLGQSQSLWNFEFLAYIIFYQYPLIYYKQFLWYHERC